jgi:hypothetical protein
LPEKDGNRESTRFVVPRPLTSSLKQPVVSLHHDISTVTGEEVVLFALAEALHFCESWKG